MSRRLDDAIVALTEYRQRKAEPNLFDAIQSVTEHAGAVWRLEALAALQELARTRQEFTVEDFAPVVLGDIRPESGRRNHRRRQTPGLDRKRRLPQLGRGTSRSPGRDLAFASPRPGRNRMTRHLFQDPLCRCAETPDLLRAALEGRPVELCTVHQADESRRARSRSNGTNTNGDSPANR